MKIFELQHAPRAAHGKSPVWSAVNDSLTYVDSFGNFHSNIHSYSIVHDDTLSMSFDQSVGFAIPTSKTTKDDLFLFIGLENKVIEVNMTQLRIIRTVLTVPDKYYTKGLRFNGAKCCPDGVLYVTMEHANWRDGSQGYLFQVVQGTSSLHAPLLEDDANARIFVLRDVLVKDGVHRPGGMAWKSPNTMFLVDSAAGEIQRLRFGRHDLNDPCSKKLIERRTVYTLPQSFVDFGYTLGGIDVDNKDKLWVAVQGGGMVMRIDPATGREMFKLHLESKMPTDIAFGRGDDAAALLYITTRNDNPNSSEAHSPVITALLDRIRGVSAPVPVDTDITTTIESQSTPQLSCLSVFCCT